MSPLERSLVKRGAKRTCERVESGGRALFVKRYHGNGALERLFDRARAAQELRVLAELARRGVDVPHPVEARARDGRWELVTEWIEGGVSLDDVLRGKASPPGAPAGAFAPALGRLVARAHEKGLDHRDLHPGNLLISPGGRAWLCDLRAARLAPGEVAPELALRDLAALAGALRERAGERDRAVALAAYLAARPARAGRAIAQAAGLAAPGGAPGAALARRLEPLARARRRAAVERSARRWLRASSVARPISEGGVRGLVSASLDGATRAEALDLARAGSVRAREVALVELPVGRAALVLRARRGAVERAWLAAGRALEHALPGAEPALLAAEPALAVFLLPAGTSAAAPAEARAPGALGALSGALADRGLAPVRGHEDLLADGEGGLRLAPWAALAPLGGPASGPAPDLAALALASAGGAGAGDRAAFGAAFAEALRGGPRERALVAAAFGLEPGTARG